MSKPWIIGPTWAKNDDGSWLLPEKSLGWGVIDWMYNYLLTPGGKYAGKPFLPTLEQARFILWWYAVDDNGNFVYRNGVLRRLKGWGKDPLAGALALVELCGPVEFDYFDDDGNPVGKPKYDPWIQIAAVSQEQTRNTFTLFSSFISPRLKEEHKLDLNKTIVYDGRGKMIEGVTSSPLALEGKRPTFVILNEIQWWLDSNAGTDMYRIIKGNVTKAAYGGCRSLSICNAHIPGQDSVGEALWDSYSKSTDTEGSVDVGLLYDALEAPSDTPLSEIPSPDEDPEGFEEGLKKLREGVEIARGDATWLDIDSIIASMFDQNNPVSESRRMFLNQINASEDSWISPVEWDRLISDVKLEDGDEITIGFDGSKSSDHTAICVCRVSDGALFLIRAWDPDKCPGKEVPRADVDSVIRSLFKRYKVVGFRADVHEFEAYVDEWSKDFGRKMKIKASPSNAIAYDMRGMKKKFALDCERFLDAVLEGEIKHDGSKLLKWYITNCHRHPTNYDAIAIRKASKDSSKKIDGAVTAVLAFGARQEFMMSKKYRKGKGGALF